MRYGLNTCFLTLIFLAFGAAAMADTFGAGANQFNIDFVPISGATNPASGYGIVNHDYRMGTCTISNDQWNKFTASLGVPVTGADGGYYSTSFYTGADVPVNDVSWFEAAQFVNWLNTSTGHQPAYKFTGTQGTRDYTFATWSAAEAAGGTNLYRNKDAYYFLPSEDEWVKAAYWNGASLQTYATKPGDTLFQGNGTNGGWNYYTTQYATNPMGPWAVNGGSQELNGTFNMMGNVWQWTESPYGDLSYGTNSSRSLRGGSFLDDSSFLSSSYRFEYSPTLEPVDLSFRVASVPEPGSLLMTAMIALSGLLYFWQKNDTTQ